MKENLNTFHHGTSAKPKMKLLRGVCLKSLSLFGWKWSDAQTTSPKLIRLGSAGQCWAVLGRAEEEIINFPW